jgi:hypothetical protein
MHMQVAGTAVYKLSMEALRELKRDGTVQAWGQKDFKRN